MNGRSVFVTRRCRSSRGTALIETAIIMPLYMLILLGVIYFGYAGLTKQEQGVATAYTAWLPAGPQGNGVQPADLLTEFWPWAGTAQGSAVQATAGDTTLALPENRARLGDEYYAMEMYVNASNGAVQWIWPGDPNYQPWPSNDQNHIIFIPSQLAGAAYSLEGGKDTVDAFDRERVTVELWNYALGHTTQSSTWVAGQGLVQQENRNWDSFSSYLNSSSPSAFNQGGGFVDAPAATNGWVPFGSESGAGQGPSIGPYQNMMTAALDREPGQALWLQRGTVVSQLTYQPPFFPQIIADVGAPPTTFTNYVTANYPTPAFVPTATLRFDVTGRAVNVFRYAAGEGGQTPASLLVEAGNLLGGSLPPPDDQAILALTTVKGSWSPN